LARGRDSDAKNRAAHRVRLNGIVAGSPDGGARATVAMGLRHHHWHAFRTGSHAGAPGRQRGPTLWRLFRTTGVLLARHSAGGGVTATGRAALKCTPGQQSCVLEEGSTGFCAVEGRGWSGDAKTRGTLPSASEASITAAMNLFLILVGSRLTRHQLAVCDWHHRAGTVLSCRGYS
jgi:hypothetical protein